MKSKLRNPFLIVGLMMLPGASTWAGPVAPTFTYQGQLKDGGLPASGVYDVRFSLYDAESSGVLVAGPLVFDGGPGNQAAVVVESGLFNVELEFEDSFDGNAVWLHVDVRPHGVGGYTPLTPRQSLTPVPFALYALDGPGGTGPWTVAGANIHSTNSGNVGIGTDTPAVPLHVNGDIRSDGGFGITASDPSDLQSAVTLGWLDNVARIRVSGNGPGASGGLDIQKTGDRSLMRIYNSGDVWFRGGLDVSGNVWAKSGELHAVNPNDPRDSVFLGWGVDPYGDDVARIRIAGDGTGAYNGLEIQRPGNVSLFRITHHGAVGIGTRTPNRVLSVEGDGYFVDNLGVGTRSPQARLHVISESDAEPDHGGFIVSGSTAAENIAIDNNEIMARNNGATSTLFLNNDGGNVVVGGNAQFDGNVTCNGTIDIGYEIIRGNCVGYSAQAFCSPGKRVLGGGCFSGIWEEEIEFSYPLDNNGWSCGYDTDCEGEVYNKGAYVICANVR